MGLAARRHVGVIVGAQSPVEEYSWFQPVELFIQSGRGQRLTPARCGQEEILPHPLHC